MVDDRVGWSDRLTGATQRRSDAATATVTRDGEDDEGWKETRKLRRTEYRKKEGGKRREGENQEQEWMGGRLAGLNMTTRVPEGLSMVADSTSGPAAGVWAAGIQVEAAANPKESSPWLPAPASTGLHAGLSALEHVQHERTSTTRARGAACVCAHARIIPLSHKYALPLSGTDATLGQRRDVLREPT